MKAAVDFVAGTLTLTGINARGLYVLQASLIEFAEAAKDRSTRHLENLACSLAQEAQATAETAAALAAEIARAIDE